jgi:hypothetical protein
MYVILSTEIEVNNKPTPKHNEHVPTYELGNTTKQILTSQLIQMAMNFATTKNTNEIEDFVYHMQPEIPRKPEPSWNEKADEDAKEFIHDYLLDEIIEQLMEDGEFDEDIINSAFHETIIDLSYDNKEAIDLISDLYEYEETDSGLWEGLDWDQVLSSKAARTYGNAVYEKATEILNTIREKIDMNELDEEIAENISEAAMTPENFTVNEINEFYEMTSGEKVDWIKENYENTFDEILKEKLTTLIEEEL